MDNLSEQLFRIAKLPPDDMAAALLDLAASQQKLERRRVIVKKSTRKWRENLKAKSSREPSREPLPDYHGNDEKVHVNHHVMFTGADCILTPTITDIQDIRSRQSPSKTKETKGTRLDPGWNPSEDDLAFARNAGLAEYQITNEVASFIDYWIGVPGAKGIKLTWSATWRNRIRMVAPRLTKRSTPAKPPTSTQIKTQKYERLYANLKRSGADGGEDEPQGSRQLGSPDGEIIPPDGPSSLGRIYRGADQPTVPVRLKNGSDSPGPHPWFADEPQISTIASGGKI